MKYYFAQKKNNFVTKTIHLFIFITVCLWLMFVVFPLIVSLSVFEEDTIYSWYQIAVVDFHDDEQTM